MVRGDNIAMVGVHVKQNTGTPLMYTTQGHCHFVTRFYGNKMKALST